MKDKLPMSRSHTTQHNPLARHRIICTLIPAISLGCGDVSSGGYSSRAEAVKSICIILLLAIFITLTVWSCHAIIVNFNRLNTPVTKRLAKKLAFDVAERDNKERPTCPEIWQNPYYSVWKSNFGRPMPSMRLVDFHKGTTGSTSRTARATPAPAACGSSAVDTAACAS